MCGVSSTLTHGLAAAAGVAVAAAGVLVGAGSFGRVFAGRLGDQEVAIKVLHHDDAAALQVASEVSLGSLLGVPAFTAVSVYVPLSVCLCLPVSACPVFVSCALESVWPRLPAPASPPGVHDDAVQPPQPCQGFPLCDLGVCWPVSPPDTVGECVSRAPVYAGACCCSVSLTSAAAAARRQTCAFPDMLLQDSQEVEDSARLRSVLGSSSSNGSGTSSVCGRPKPQYGRLPAHSCMLETWILCELCNVGNMQDAVMLREHSVFFEGDTPQMVSATTGVCRPPRSDSVQGPGRVCAVAACACVSGALSRPPDRFAGAHTQYIVCSSCKAAGLRCRAAACGCCCDHPALAAALPQGIILQTMLGVARGMECLHANNCLHGDLKASNVLLSVTEPGGAEASNGEVEIVPKVSDFGLSQVMLEGATHHSTHTMGTITHQAPGVLGSRRVGAVWVLALPVLGYEAVCAARVYSLLLQPGQQ